MFVYEVEPFVSVKVRYDGHPAGMAYVGDDGHWYALVVRARGYVHLDEKPRTHKQAITAIEGDVFASLVGAR
ncbi:hypothetical protein ACIBG8_19415 [Nonomuraea sp. NPDC050556]|uniref:hypothetical protein n=1 Tax=Nonomuraea sp. NPDC050556 TaxID=3364369 RepID=UPI003793C5B0